MADVALKVNGRVYSGWTAASVTRGIESVSGSFELTATDRWAGAEPWPIREGDECTVSVGQEVLLTGYVDRRRVSLAAGEHSLTVSGRDRTGDLVDCSAVLRTWEFLATPVLKLAQQVARPFGVAVSMQQGLALPPPPPKLVVDPGDSAYEVIERACRAAALLPVSDGKGGLVLLRPGTARAHTAIVEGQNLLAGSSEVDTSGRYRRVVVRGQSSGGDALFGGDAAAVQASAEDLNVLRASRVLLVRPEGVVTTALAKKRAEWETAVRAARALTVSLTVQGWTQGDGRLWPVNALVQVRSPSLGVDGELLVTEATYSLDDSAGTTTQLKLRLPGAYEPEPVIPRKKETEVGLL